MKHLEQLTKEKDAIFDKYKALQDETDKFLAKMKEEF